MKQKFACTLLGKETQEKGTVFVRRCFSAQNVGQNIPHGTEGTTASEGTGDPPGVLTFTTAMALGAIGALGVAGLGVWGVLQLSLGVAKSTGRTLHPAQPGVNEDLSQAGTTQSKPSLDPPRPALSALPHTQIVEPNNSDKMDKSWWTFWR
eukprot:jgi/Botrbrau1/4955/Bobra.0122s0032.2